MKKKAFIFSGQGAQKPYMGKSFYDSFLCAKEVYQEAEDTLSTHITSKIFSDDEEGLKQTDFCQVALFTTFMAILRVMEKEAAEIVPSVTAGLSLGEFAALVAAKKARFQDVLPLIKQRGILMKRAASDPKQGMLAVLGLEASQVPDKYQIASLNCPGQIVIAGSEEEMREAATELKEAGAKKVLPLKVTGAFHTSYMENAKKHLAPFIKGCTMFPSDISLVMNYSGRVVDDIEEIKKELILQTTSKTRWVDCVNEMERLDVDYVELGASQLSAINKKMNVKNSTISIKEVKDLEELYEKV